MRFDNKSAPVAHRNASATHADPTGFPWGLNHPTRAQRVVFATTMAILSGALLFLHYRMKPRDWSDFTQIWFGANALLRGADPYQLIGPGKELDILWPLLYPATALVAAIPLSALSDHVASIVFTAGSVFLLAYGITRDSWHRLPIFASIAFVNSVQLAQWSILMTAAVFLPWLGVVAAAKPSAGFPPLAANKSPAALIAAVIGGALLLAVSLVMLPTWPQEWLAAVRSSEHLRAPITRVGGFVVLLALLRWRRWEAWLIVAAACMPHTWAWYNVLILLAIPRTYREACVLSLVSSGGKLAGIYFIGGLHTTETYRSWGALMIATAYLPAVIVVLRHPNDWSPPAWLEFLMNARSRARPSSTRDPR